MTRISGAGVVAICCAVLLSLLELGEAHAEHAIEGSDVGLDLRRRSLVVAKSSALVVVFGVAFLGSIIPYFFRRSSSFLLLGTQFAGGVFLTTALMHFFMDSDVTFKHLLPTTAYSFTAMFTIAGFLLTMLADVMVHRVYNRRAFQQLRKEDLEGATEGMELLHLSVNFKIQNRLQKILLPLRKTLFY